MNLGSTFAGFRDDLYSQIGLTKDQLDLGQAAIDAAKPYLNKVPNNPEASGPQAVQFIADTANNLLGPKIAGIPVILIALAGAGIYLAVRK